MAFKDVEDLYFTYRSQYNELIAFLQEYDKDHHEGIEEDEGFKIMKAQVEEIRANLDPISYFITLWKMPDKADKEACEAWKKEHETEYNYILERNKRADDILKENQRLIDDVKKFVEEQEERNKK